MSSNGHGGGKVPSLDGWLVVVCGQGSVVGKIKGDTEESLKETMRAGRVAGCTLDPAYMFASTVTMIDMGHGAQPGRMFVVTRLEQALDLGPKAKTEFHTMLTGPFQFLAALDADARAHIWKRIEDSDRRAAAASSGLILTPAR